jgi:hypothetical protein
MPDYDQMLRNVGYGLAHRPAQVIRWLGEQFKNEASPLGKALIDLADQVDAEAYDALRPYVPPLPPLTGPPPGPPGPFPPPPPPSGALPRYVKPSGTIYPFLTCPKGYTLVRVSPLLEFPGYSCLLNGQPEAPIPPPDLWAY